MKTNFDRALGWVLEHEGGYVNDPVDPGGPTNRGVTQRVYTAWLRRNGEASRDVRGITNAEVRAIYRAQYWDVVRGDDLPPGVDYAVFDFAVNSGPSRSVKFLQAVLGIQQDGVIGSVTLAAVMDADPLDLITRLCDNRLSWLRRLKTFWKYGNGWTIRVQDVKATALEMARGRSFDVSSRPAPAPAPKTPAEPRTAPVAQARDNADTLTAGGVLTGLLGGATQTEGVVQIMLAGAALLVVGFLVWRNWKAAA